MARWCTQADRSRSSLTAVVEKSSRLSYLSILFVWWDFVFFKLPWSTPLADFNIQIAWACDYSRTLNAYAVVCDPSCTIDLKKKKKKKT